MRAWTDGESNLALIRDQWSLLGQNTQTMEYFLISVSPDISCTEECDIVRECGAEHITRLALGCSQHVGG